MNLERIRKIISNLEHSIKKIEAKGCETGLTKAEFEDYLMVKQELKELNCLLLLCLERRKINRRL